MLINKGDIIEVYDEDHLTICRSCIGIVEKVLHNFVVFKVIKINGEDELKKLVPNEYQNLIFPLIDNVKGQIRATSLENIINHSTEIPLEYANSLQTIS